MNIPNSANVRARHGRARFYLLCALMLSMMLGCGHKKTGTSEATLEDLNNALKVWSVTKPALPTDVSQLTNDVTMRGKRLPTAPPGKKLVIDAEHTQVVWADQ